MNLQLNSKFPTRDAKDAGFLIFQPFQINPNWLDKLTNFFLKNKETNSRKYSTKRINQVQSLGKHKENIKYTKYDSDQKGNNFMADLNRDFTILQDPYKDLNKTESELIYELSRSKNASEALKILQIMWQESKLCDLIIVVENNEYLAHRVVLAFFSERFK